MTILTDDELLATYATGEFTLPHREFVIDVCRKVEAAVLAKLAQQVPVAWMYTLEYGANIANTKVSLSQLNYPFGVCGADYLPRNGDGMSYVRQTPLYTLPAPQQADRQRVPDGYVLVSKDRLKALSASIHGDCYMGEEWEKQAVASMLAAAPEAPTQETADVWHEGSRSFYRAVLLKKLSLDEVFFDPAGSPEA